MGELTDDFIFGDRPGSDWSDDDGASPRFVDGVRHGDSDTLADGSRIIHARHHSEIYRKTNAVLAAQAAGAPVVSTDAAYEKLNEQHVGRRNDHRNAGMRSSVVTLMNSCLGASLLVLPFVCGETGLAVFLILVSFIGVVSNETLKLLTLCVKHTEQSCYQGVGREAFGARGATGTSILITCQLFGFMVAYLIVVGNMLQSVVKLLPHAEANLVAWQIGVSALVVLPLCMLRRMHYLRFSAIVAITLFMVYVVASSVDATHQLITWPTKTVPGTVTWIASVTRILAALPVVCCSYACHQNLFPIIEEVQRPTVGRLARVTRNAMGLVAAIYCVCGVAGYLTFLSETQGDLLLNYAHTATFVPQQFLQFVGYFIGTAIVLSLPVMCFELRNGLDIMFFGGKQFSWVRHTAWNVALVTATTTVAILIPQVETVFSFIGALCSTTVVFTLPGVFYLKVAPEDARDGRFTRAKAWGVAVGGALLTPVCLTILTLQQVNVLPKS